MDIILIYVVLALTISITINLWLKRQGISQIIGYIITGIIITYAFGLQDIKNSHELELIGEFGIVFLMFTIGLELSLAKLKLMKYIVFFNGFFQVFLSAAIVYAITHFGFGIKPVPSLIISMALSLSSTAVVLTYLKQSKEIYAPYGQNAMGILIFQDLAVIPMLLLMGFLNSEDVALQDILIGTAVSATIVLLFLLTIGKKIVEFFLRHAANSHLEELFIGSVLAIVVGASLFAHSMGFTYSLGAFVAGMIIAETKYHYKVEADIAPFKDLLLGTFFITVGMKIDLTFLYYNFTLITTILLLIMVLKTVIIFGIIRLRGDNTQSFKTALALSQVGEFSFALLAIAQRDDLISYELAQLLVLLVVLSMIITPFMIANVNKISSLFFKDKLLVEEINASVNMRNHVIVCGYSVVGKFAVRYLKEKHMNYVIIDNSYKHVKEGLEDGEPIFYGNAEKVSVLQALSIDQASAVLLTLENFEKKRLICESILKYNSNLNLVVKIDSLEEKLGLSDLAINYIVDGKKEVAALLVEASSKCTLPSR